MCTYENKVVGIWVDKKEQLFLEEVSTLLGVKSGGAAKHLLNVGIDASDRDSLIQASAKHYWEKFINKYSNRTFKYFTRYREEIEKKLPTKYKDDVLKKLDDIWEEY
jgi:hypothetical protein